MNDSNRNFEVSSLHKSCLNQPKEALDFLLANPDTIIEAALDGSTAIHWMAASTDSYASECLVELVDHDTTLPEIGDKSGALPIHWAARWGSLENLVSLARLGKHEFPVRDEMGRDLAHWFALASQDPFAASQKLEFLNSQMAVKLDGRDNRFGGTPLHWAVSVNGGEVKTLVAGLPDLVHERDFNGATPLHWLAASGIGIATNLPLLVKAGAATDVACHDGTVIDELIRPEQSETWVNHLTGTRPSAPPL